MELEKVLHMKGGNEETSYAQAAFVTKRVTEMTKPIREEAMAQLFDQVDNLLLKDTTTLCVADLGCASGPNTLTVMSELIITSERIRKRANKQEGKYEYQVYLNDLLGNDFNCLFMSLPSLYQQLMEEVGLNIGQCFVRGVPGSFYGRLFPHESLHFVHSSYSLQWLSKVPDGLNENKLGINLSSASPPSAVKAYKAQFQADTASFLKSRSEELVKGGKMLLTYLGRATEDPLSIEHCWIWDSFSIILNQLVSEGLIQKETVEAFNIPVYHPSAIEVIQEIEKEGSFSINSSEVSQVYCDDEENDTTIMNQKGPQKVTKRSYEPYSRLIRSVVESLFASHFESAIIDEVFNRYGRVLEDVLNGRRLFQTSVTVSVTKN